MCTVSLYRAPNPMRVIITMNRDEARTRGPERPPTLHQDPPTPDWIAPRDSDRGGTWFAVNARGLVVCLLNRYQDALTFPTEQPESRGSVIPQLMGAASVADARALLTEPHIPLSKLPPFTLLLAGRDGSAQLAWRGSGVVQDEPIEQPWHLVSSSFEDPERVLPFRKALFDAWLKDGAAFDGPLPAFHLMQPPGESVAAPLMARSVSCTRSIIQAAVNFDAGEALLRYGPVENDELDRVVFAQSRSLTMSTPDGDGASG